MRLGVLASGAGTTLQAIARACADRQIVGTVALVVSNNSRSGAAEFARAQGLDLRHLSSWTHPSAVDLDAAMLGELSEHGVELVVLAGYMKLVGPQVLSRYRNRIVNTHPALLPEFGGRGMYGRKVHEAVLKAHRSETGVSIHLVDEEYDHGPVIDQCRIPVHPDDDPDSLSERVKERERTFYVEALSRIVDGRLKLPGG